MIGTPLDSIDPYTSKTDSSTNFILSHIQMKLVTCKWGFTGLKKRIECIFVDQKRK